MLRTVIKRIRALLNLGQSVRAQLESIERTLLGAYRDLGGAVKKTSEAATKVSKQLSRRIESVEGQVSGVQQQLTQLRLLMQRLESTVSGRETSEEGLGSPIPMSVSDPSPAEGEDGSRQADAGRPIPFPPEDLLVLDRCPVCGGGERTVVCEYNKFVLTNKAPDEEFYRYDFSVCHACGVCYAARRPIGTRINWLLANFVEATNKAGGGRELKNPMLNPYPLTDGDREQLERRAARGVFVSEHLGVPSDEYLPGVLKDRLANSIHLEILTSLVSLKAPRVLEVRPRTGALLEGLRRYWGAEVYGMPIWESQQYLLHLLYDIPAPLLIDFDHFEIPFEGKFDLILCNHMFTHCLRPREFFDTIRSRLSPGGYLYLYNEPDDQDSLRGSQSIIATLNPLHVQAFDQPSMIRGLRANGFAPTFTWRHRDCHLCLLQATDEHPQPPPESWDVSSRVREYGIARDRAILCLPKTARWRFKDEWDAVVERCVVAGVADFDDKGRLRVLRR